VHVLEGHTRAVTSVAFSADGAQIVSEDCHGRTIVWDAARGVRLDEVSAADVVLASGTESSSSVHAGRLEAPPQAATGAAPAGSPAAAESAVGVGFTFDAAPSSMEIRRADAARCAHTALGLAAGQLCCLRHIA